jgi:Ala-tRNA(Pro) deacylase
VYRVHVPAETAVDLAAAEHVTGFRVAKVVILRMGGDLAMAVVPATDRVNLRPLEESTGTHPTLASEAELATRFQPCAPGAAAPLALFGAAIYVDDRLLHQPTILFAAGTHDDAAELETSAWAWSERVSPITNLGRRIGRRWRVRAGARGTARGARSGRRSARVESSL